jgi:GDP-L-fucose synthase
MFFQNQKVLVTGAAGLIGSNLVSRLVREGARVRGTLHKRKPLKPERNVDYVTCDLTRAEDCRAVVQDARYVFHCAANTTGALTTATTPMDHVTANVVMNAWLLEAAYHAHVEKFLWLSSTTGYPDTDKPVKEDDMFVGEPYEKYFFVGHMKRFTEILCRMYGEKLPRRMTTIVLRPSNVYGPGDKFEFERSHVTAALIRKVVERHNPIEVWGTGDDVRDLIYVEDFVEAMMLAMQKLNAYTTLNIASGRGYNVKQILHMILELEGYRDAKIVFDPSKPTMIPVRLVDTSKAERLIGFRAKVDLREGLKKTIDWYKATRNLPPR